MADNEGTPEHFCLDCIPLEELFHHLKCSTHGLTSLDVQTRHKLFGFNKLEAENEKESKIRKFFSYMWDPVSWVMEGAALASLILPNENGPHPDWQDSLVITSLLLTNSTIRFYAENKAELKIRDSLGKVALTYVLRDGKWSEHESSTLVPGDIISLKAGDIVPADVRLLWDDHLVVDQCSFTGVSVSVDKNPSDAVFSGSICKQGRAHAVVIATGVYTFYGKTTHQMDSTMQAGRFNKVAAWTKYFCLGSVFVGATFEFIIMCAVQRRKYKAIVENLLVPLIAGMPISMPTVVAATLASGCRRLCQKGVVVKSMVAIEKIASMDVLCSGAVGLLNRDEPTIDQSLIEVFVEGVEKHHVLVLAARASRIVDKDHIDRAIAKLLEVPHNYQPTEKVHFHPLDPADETPAITYTVSSGLVHRAMKGAPEEIFNLCNIEEAVRDTVRIAIENFAGKGFCSLGVAHQEIHSFETGPWQFIGLLPLLYEPRQDSAIAMRKASSLGVNVKTITGDELDISKKTWRKLEMGRNMYTYPALDDPSIEELIEKADGLAEVPQDGKDVIVERLQKRKHICGFVGAGVDDALVLRKADVGIAVAGAACVARSAADIVLTEEGFGVIVKAIDTSRDIFQRMKSYMIYAVSNAIHMVFAFVLVSLLWKFDFAPFMVLIIAFMNNGTIMIIQNDKVKPSPIPSRWKLKDILVRGVVLGGYLAAVTVFFFWMIKDTSFIPKKFHVRSIRHRPGEMMTALYLQVSIASQGLMFATRSPGITYAERPGKFLLGAYIVPQLIATLIAVFGDLGFAKTEGCGWGWAGVIWLFSLMVFVGLEIVKLLIGFSLDGKAGDNPLVNKSNYGKEERRATWTAALNQLEMGEVEAD